MTENGNFCIVLQCVGMPGKLGGTKMEISVQYCNDQLGLVSHRTPPSLGSSRPSGACSPYKCLYSP